MLGTTPSATNCRAISRQSQKDKERPRSSGRSQAILTRSSATSGGKDRRAAGSGLVVKSGESVVPEPFGPLADVPHAQAAEPGGLRRAVLDDENPGHDGSSTKSPIRRAGNSSSATPWS